MKPPGFWLRPPGLAAGALSPLGALYDLAGRLRRRTARPLRVAVPVICVGNIPAGGTGKTPVVLSLLRILAARGQNPHALSRGYGGSAKGPLRVDPADYTAAEVGDEPLLLAAVAPTWVARDRAAGARTAVADGAGCIVMDDGHQNPTVAKDLSLVVVDGAVGFGNRLVMPAGPLRESIETGLERADAVAVIGDDRHGVGAEVLTRGLPLLTGRLVPDPAAAAALRGRRVYAFAGIGRPEKFFATLAETGAEVVEKRTFPDHHPFSGREIAILTARAAKLDALPVTTTKDRARFPADRRAAVTVLPVELRWDDEAALIRLLQRLEKR